MTTTTPSIAALLDAARAEPPDRVAMLTLADVAEEAGDDAQAGAWRWLADPLQTGWERRAAVLAGLAADAGISTAGVWVEGRGPQANFPARLYVRFPGEAGWEWQDGRGWRQPIGGWVFVAPPAVRAAVLAACRAALAVAK